MNDKDKIIELQDKIIKLQEELALLRASQPAPYIITYPTYPPQYTWHATAADCCGNIKLGGFYNG